AIWHDFFYTELTTGLRRGEICSLMWRDFDGKAGTLKVCRTLHSKKLGVFSLGDTKTGMGTRTIVLPHSTAELLRQRKKHSISHWIFQNPIKPELPTSPATAYNHLKTLLKQANLPDIRFHDLRHPDVKLSTKNKRCEFHLKTQPQTTKQELIVWGLCFYYPRYRY
ncbi:MAG: site-specific integrase, partial [Anaerovoracaceae bacterium]